MNLDPLELHRAYRRLFDCPDGRAVLADIRLRGGTDRVSFCHDPHRTAFNEGRRSMALHVERMLDEDAFGHHAADQTKQKENDQ